MKPIVLLCLVLVLIFVAVGCENKINKQPEPTKPNKSPQETTADGDSNQGKSIVPEESQDSPYLEAVREFGDNVLKYGRDTYGPKHTPLFVDGLNIHTHEPVKWISPVLAEQPIEESTTQPQDSAKGPQKVEMPAKGDLAKTTGAEEWILSNFASQQTLLRTLDGLSAVTGDPKYRDAAVQAVKYAFENLRDLNGLFYWGSAAAYDALTETVRLDKSHHYMKLNYPYYELMWNVDPDVTKKFIEAFWVNHIHDWSNLNMNRYSDLGRPDLVGDNPWNHTYDSNGAVFYKSRSNAVGFLSTGSSLIHAGAMLHVLTGQEEPLIWSKRLAKRYVDTRHPNTGMSYEAYNVRWSELGDDLKEHFDDPRTTPFPYRCFKPNPVGGPIRYENRQAWTWLSFLLTGEMLGDAGNEFTQWALEEFTAWGEASYRKEDNSFVPMLTSGVKLEGYVLKNVITSSGTRDVVVKPYFAAPSTFWAYAVAYRVTGDDFMWQMVRNIAAGNNFGDIGENQKQRAELRVDTACVDVYALLGFLELYDKTNKQEFWTTARRIADNILESKLHKGFFTLSKEHIYSRFDCFEPLALLRLIAAIEPKSFSVPKVWPCVPMFRPPYRHRRELIDRVVIYDLTESAEVPMSLQEAAAIGDVDLVTRLIDEGAQLDGAVIEDETAYTALHRAAIRGHRDIAELLLERGANVEARDFSGARPLHFAVENGHQDIVELLLAHGADVAVKDKLGRNPFDILLLNNDEDIRKLLLTKIAETGIYTAVRMGDQGQVKVFLDQGIDIDSRDDKGNSLLHLAVEGYLKNIVQFLVDRGADVNIKDKRGYTSLDRAISRNQIGIIEILVVNGAQFNVKGPDGRTAFSRVLWSGQADNEELVDIFVKKGADVSTFHRAAALGDMPRINTFLEQGSSVNTRDEYGYSPLFWASLEVAELLIAQGADVNFKANNQETPLHHATWIEANRIAQLLLAHGADVNAKDAQGYTPLIRSVMAVGGNRQLFELFIAHGADVNSKTRMGHTALHWVVATVRRDGFTSIRKGMLEVLIANGADEDAKDNNDRTPLTMAIKRGHLEVAEALAKAAGGQQTGEEASSETSIHMAARMEYQDRVKDFLDRGADINVKDDKGHSILHYAVTEGHESLTRFLIDQGADVNIRDGKGFTPLDRAISRNQIGIIEILVVNGAQFNVKGPDGRTLFDRALWSRNRELVDIFVKKGADVSTLHRAAAIGDVVKVNKFLEQGFDVDTKDDQGWSPLFWATRMNKRETAEALISQGADVNFKIDSQITLLHHAARVGADGVVQLLLTHGADVNAKNRQGLTPLHAAAEEGHRQIVELLITSGADFNARNTSNDATPLHRAVVGGHREVVETLLAHGADMDVKNRRGRTPLAVANQFGRAEIVELLHKHGAKE